MKRLLPKTLLQKSREPKTAFKIAIAVLFSIIAIGTGFSDLAYVPLSDSKAIDLTIVGVMFGALIGGYSVAIPLALIWSLVTWFNLDSHLITYPLWALILTREVFVIVAVFSYNLFRKMYKYSPYNVYRAIFASIIFKNLIGMPFDYMVGGQEWLLFRAEQLIIEVALCCVFMSLLIKHLRQIHILNGVKKVKIKND